MSEREQFEEHAKRRRLSLAYGDCGYVYSYTNEAWEAWQASREALKAEQMPIGEVKLGEYDDAGNHPAARVVCLHDQADWENFPEGTKLYLSPQPARPSHHPIDTTPNQYDALGKGGEQ